MKKILFVLCLTFLSVTAIQAQTTVPDNNMKVGVSAILPIGDFSNAYNFGIQGNFAYLFQLDGMDNAFEFGPMASLFYYIGKNIGSVKISDAIFLPVGGHARYSFDNMFVGADVGYAIGISPSGSSGGVLFQPKFGYNIQNLALVASYSAITRSGTIGSINVGVEFTF